MTKKVITKTCSRCGETKPSSEFYETKLTADGLLSHCRQCHRKAMRLSRESREAMMRARTGRGAGSPSSIRDSNITGG